MKLKILFLIISSLFFTNSFSQENVTDSEKEKVLNKKYKEQEKERKGIRKEINGSTLKELTFVDINKKKHTLESLKGKIIVLNFWFIQCKPCVEEFPELNALKMKFKNKPVEFFAVTWNDEKSLTKFLKTKKLDYTVVPDASLINKFKISFYPYNILIDQNGKVEYVNDVLSLNIIKKIERKINQLL